MLQKNKPSNSFYYLAFFYNLFTSSLKILPLSAKFLNMSNAALAGDKSTISPGIACFLASLTLSSKLLHLIIFKVFSSASSSLKTLFCIFSAV